jgi:DNA-binding transcriptional LysR family regulator
MQNYKAGGQEPLKQARARAQEESVGIKEPLKRRRSAESMLLWKPSSFSTRFIAVRIGYFIAAPLLVAQSDLVLTMPARAANAVASGHAVVLRPCPFQPETGPVCMVWHDRFQNDPAVKWLRGEVAAVGKQLRQHPARRAEGRRRRRHIL